MSSEKYTSVPKHLIKRANLTGDVSFCVISHRLFMTSGCSLTQLWFFFFFPPPAPPPFFYLSSSNHVWSSFHLFIACLNPNIGLSSLPPSQSSVDHKEFKRCGPFDPYINAKVCTQHCWKPFFFFFLKLLLCYPAVSACCAWACSVAAAAAAWGATLPQGYEEALNFTCNRTVTVLLWLSSHVHWRGPPLSGCYFSENDDNALVHALLLQRGSFHMLKYCCISLLFIVRSQD